MCAEIGVWKGEFSARIRRRTAPRELHLSDPWRFLPEYPERLYGGRAAGSQRDMDRIFEDVQARFGNVPDVIVHRGRSADVLPTFDDDHFDWVYIDGNHSYAFVLADLEMCLAKTKPGGVIAGDDYLSGAREGYPVRRAVLDFVERHWLAKRLTVLDSQFLIAAPGEAPADPAAGA